MCQEYQGGNHLRASKYVFVAKQRGTEEWLHTLGAIGVPCGPINDMAQTFAHPQVKHRHMKIDLDHPASGKVPLIANPIRFTERPLVYSRPPPMLGQHTDEVLADLLGLDETRIATLRDAQII